MSVEVRIASGSDDLDAAVEILVDAFYDDPAWSFGFPDPAKRRDQHRWFWRHCALAALPHSTLFLTTNGASTSVWLPPGIVEDYEGGAEFVGEAREFLGPDADRFLRAVEIFEAAQPQDEPHYYLSLLGTRTADHGHRYGLDLLEANLAMVDEAGCAAYLEASHPGNIPLYERYGFRVIGGFDMPDGGPRLATMWRAAAV